MERDNPELVDAFAAVLVEARAAAKLRQEAMPERANVSTRYDSHLENGERQPTLIARSAVSEPLGLTMSEMLLRVEAHVKR